MEKGRENIPIRLINQYQKNFPIVSQPFVTIAEEQSLSEDEVIRVMREAQQAGVVSRVGPVFAPKRVGVSTLAALSVSAERLDAVAEVVSSFSEVNHNYEREHELNLWFVLHANDESHLQRVLKDIENQTGCRVHDLRLEEEYRIDLGFDLT